MMRYILVEAPTARFPDQRKIIVGVIVQGEGETKAKFTREPAVEGAVRGAIPKSLFDNLQSIFDSLISQGEILPSRDDSGEIVPVKVTEPRFFDVLRQWQGSHLLFTPTDSIEAATIDEAVARLYAEYVGRDRVTA